MIGNLYRWRSDGPQSSGLYLTEELEGASLGFLDNGEIFAVLEESDESYNVYKILLVNEKESRATVGWCEIFDEEFEEVVR